MTRVDGDSDVTVALVVDGRTVDRKTIRTSGRTVRVCDANRDKDDGDDTSSTKDDRNDKHDSDSDSKTTTVTTTELRG